MGVGIRNYDMKKVDGEIDKFCQPSPASDGYGVNIPTEEQFLAMLPAIRKVARNLGYAVGLHGTLARDFDLIAIPWTDDAVHPDTVAEAIKKVTGCVRWRVYRDQGAPKPHGRMVYCFDWDKQNHDNRGYIDLSVMPRLSP